MYNICGEIGHFISPLPHLCAVKGARCGVSGGDNMASIRESAGNNLRQQMMDRQVCAHAHQPGSNFCGTYYSPTDINHR